MPEKSGSTGNPNEDIGYIVKAGPTGNQGSDSGWKKCKSGWFSKSRQYNVFAFAFEKLIFFLWLFQGAQSCDYKGKLDLFYMLLPHKIAYFCAFS